MATTSIYVKHHQEAHGDRGSIAADAKGSD